MPVPSKAYILHLFTLQVGLYPLNNIQELQYHYKGWQGYSVIEIPNGNT